MKTIIVTDFDCTLTLTHFFYFTNNFKTYKNMYNLENSSDLPKLEEISSRWLNHLKIISNNSSISRQDNLFDDTEKKILRDTIFGKDRFDILVDFLETLKQKNIEIYISTKGKCEQVNEILSLFDLRKYFAEIINGGNNNLIPNPKCIQQKKDVFINNLLEQNKDTNIIYIDDDPTEYIDFMITNSLYNPENITKLKYFGGISSDPSKNIQNILEERGYSKLSTHNFYDIGLIYNGEGLDKNMMDRILSEISQKGGYYEKYLKYKKKYLSLKQKSQ